MALADRATIAAGTGVVFFDRGVIDAVAALPDGEARPDLRMPEHRYHETVFLAPPWREIFGRDPERRHGFSDAVSEYERITNLLVAAGYDPVELPRATVTERADFVVATLADQIPLTGGESDINMIS